MTTVTVKPQVLSKFTQSLSNVPKEKGTMRDIIRPLKKFGLTDNEITVYQTCLQSSESSPFTVSKMTGIPRTTIYAILTDLALKGLIELESSTGLMKQGTKVKAKNPSVLREILWAKRKDLFKQEVDLLEIIPLLKGEYLKNETNADFQFFPGMDGANKVMFDYDGVDQDTYVFDYLIPMDATGSREMNEGVDKGIKLWAKAHCTERNLIPLTPWSKHVLSYQYERNPKYLTKVEFRYLPFELENLAIMARIKGDRTWIISVKGDEVWGIKIRSANLADSLVGIHKAFWKLGVPITEETIKSWGPNEYRIAEKSR